ncbi:hypothetical protein [Neptuniibacter sp.]|uniref:hypothetical protein n=1 Tax=Neptuniibacter sp. TaxID=1962643 RepID=UPI0026145B54|nr:hypothetical protein [Neptuniibacter sp.]MCP4596236.1 hypothetical protein [Neptuniibacter sp.]
MGVVGDSIVKKIASEFRTYGGPVAGSVHPIDRALDGKPVIFALGVDVAEVVKMVLEESGHIMLLEAAKALVKSCKHGMSSEDILSRLELLDNVLKDYYVRTGGCR